ncbi:hypothetical protein CRENBAI_009728 [Crenichthys baileyi]|uniref:G-protein coupled receptors family 1 profile domain-containing protein n=1 Tax=Crenichthys baileyi TaxID=28760 RepID=A0AAV9QYC5_9TELE
MCICSTCPLLTCSLLSRSPSGRATLRLSGCWGCLCAKPCTPYTRSASTAACSSSRSSASTATLPSPRPSPPMAFASKAVFLSKLSSTAAWVLALICSLPEMLYTNISNNTCSPFSTKNDQLRVGFQASQIVLGFIVPLLVMSFCYTCIIQTLCQARSFERNKAIKVILTVVVVFTVSQVPYNIVLLWTTVVIGTGGTANCKYDNSLLFATDITQYVAFLRCCLNPFVYAFIGVKFRHDVLKLLKDFGCMSQERFYRYTCGRRRSSAGFDTETTTSFAPKGVNL